MLKEVVNYEILAIRELGTRVVLDRILTDTEKQQMTSNHFRGLDCIAQHRYAPEIKRSYFYVV